MKMSNEYRHSMPSRKNIASNYDNEEHPERRACCITHKKGKVYGKGESQVKRVVPHHLFE